MTEAARAAAAGRRSALYWLLADIVLSSPDAAFVARLRRDLQPRADEAGPLVARLGKLCASLPQSHDDCRIEQLAVEYARLFGGLKEGYGLPPPFESATAGALAGPEVAVTLAERYSEAGFPSLVNDAPADHLGVELKFLSVLCHAEMQALQERRTAKAARFMELQQQFLRDHLSRWAPGHWRNVAATAEEPFYRLAAQIALDAIHEEANASSARLASKSPPEDKGSYLLNLTP